jgi:stress responsive alpha/beta barrel protein
MYVHIAIYKWKESVTPPQIEHALAAVEAIAEKVPGIVEISTGHNTSPFSEGYSHVILLRGQNQAAIDEYRNHPDHIRVARDIEAMEDRGIGVDFVTKQPE